LRRRRVRNTGAVASETPARPERTDAGRPTRRFPRSRVTEAERRALRDEIRAVDFPTGLRGYDRAAVDRYVNKVNRLIAELEISASPESVIRRALEEVSEETRGLLEQAQESAEQITARSRSRADDRLQQALREAEEVRAAAVREAQEMRDAAERETQAQREEAAREAGDLRETAIREANELRATTGREAEEVRAAATARVNELDRAAEEIGKERWRLIDDMTAVAQQQLEIAQAAAARFPRAEKEDTGDSGPG
jgi:DivIVA domain-containing protein